MDEKLMRARWLNNYMELGLNEQGVERLATELLTIQRIIARLPRSQEDLACEPRPSSAKPLRRRRGSGSE